jgi:hypothetical protein
MLTFFQYIGFIEVATPFHDVKVLGEKRIALCNGCASLIAQKAGLKSDESIDPEIQELIGANEPKIIQKEIELTITNKVMTFFSTDDRKLLKKVEIANISIAVTVGDTLKNGFVFIGKAKTRNELKRFCFLLQSEEDPKNIYFAINVAFSMCDQASNNNKNGACSAPEKQQQQLTKAEEEKIFKKPYPPPPRLPEKGVLSYLNVGDKPGDIDALLSQKLGRPRPYLDADIKTYTGPFPDVSPLAKAYKTADGERSFRRPEPKKPEKPINGALGDLYPKLQDDAVSSVYTNVFGDDLATSLFSPQIVAYSGAPCTKERFAEICRDIEKLPYFFGLIERNSVGNYLKYEGSYLIRISESRPLTVILSVRQGGVHHILLNDKNGNVTSDNEYFSSIFHLMAFHTRGDIPFTTEGSNAIKVYIKHPTIRPGYNQQP